MQNALISGYGYGNGDGYGYGDGNGYGDGDGDGYGNGNGDGYGNGNGDGDGDGDGYSNFAQLVGGLTNTGQVDIRESLMHLLLQPLIKRP